MKRVYSFYSHHHLAVCYEISPKTRKSSRLKSNLQFKVFQICTRIKNEDKQQRARHQRDYLSDKLHWEKHQYGSYPTIAASECSQIQPRLIARSWLEGARPTMIYKAGVTRGRANLCCNIQFVASERFCTCPENIIHRPPLPAHDFPKTCWSLFPPNPDPRHFFATPNTSCPI